MCLPCFANDSFLWHPRPPPLQAANAFCAVRPPGHHAGPLGVVSNANDPNGRCDSTMLVIRRMASNATSKLVAGSQVWSFHRLPPSSCPSAHPPCSHDLCLFTLTSPSQSVCSTLQHLPSSQPRSHGFCLFNNAAIGAAYAMNVYRHAGVQRVAIVDFDVHHGNGTGALWFGCSVWLLSLVAQLEYGVLAAATTARLPGPTSPHVCVVSIALTPPTTCRSVRDQRGALLGSSLPLWPYCVPTICLFSTPLLLIICRGVRDQRGALQVGLQIRHALQVCLMFVPFCSSLPCPAAELTVYVRSGLFARPTGGLARSVVLLLPCNLVPAAGEYAAGQLLGNHNTPLPRPNCSEGVQSFSIYCLAAVLCTVYNTNPLCLPAALTLQRGRAVLLHLPPLAGLNRQGVHLLRQVCTVSSLCLLHVYRILIQLVGLNRQGVHLFRNGCMCCCI